MKKISILILCLVVASSSYSQKKYFRTSGETIFSFSNVSDNNVPIDSKMRFTFFFHLGEYFNYDLNKTLGFYTGLGIRNIGIITSENNETIKRRTYAAGVPVAFKLGALDRNSFFYTGGEYEYLFHYKEKRENSEGTSVYRSWNSKKVNTLAPSVFVGLQLKSGINFKFKYYLSDFLNTQYTEKINNISVKPFEKIKSQLFTFSITMNLNKYKFEKIKKYNPIKKEPKTIEV